MTALAMDRITTWMGSLPRQSTKPVKEADVIYKGAMIGLDAAGDAVPGGDAAQASHVLGRAMHAADNSGGGDGDKEIRYEAGVFAWDNSSGDALTEADLPAVVYCEDDQTVAKTSDGGTLKIAGIGLWIDDEGQVVTLCAPWVPLMVGGFAAPAMQAVDATLVAGTVTIDAGITVEPDSEVIVSLIGAITGSTNFASVGELKASRVAGVPGTGELVIQAYGADGALDSDAAGDVRVIILSPQS